MVLLLPHTLTRLTWMLRCCVSMSILTVTSSLTELMECHMWVNNGKMLTWMDSAIIQQVHFQMTVLRTQESRISSFKAVLIMSTMVLLMILMHAIPTTVALCTTAMGVLTLMKTVGQTTMVHGSMAIVINRIGSNPRTVMETELETITALIVAMQSLDYQGMLN